MADSDQSLTNLRYNQVSGALEAFGGGSPQWTQLTLSNVDPTQVPATRLVSTTSPLLGGGDLSADRTLSIQLADAGHNGYLSSGDWTAFHNKLDATLPDANIFVGSGGSAHATAMTGGATISTGGVVTLTNSAVTGQPITGFVSGAGTVTAADTILTAINKLDGNVSANRVTSIHADSGPNLTGAVQLVSGTNISLNQVGQAITVNASGGGGLPVVMQSTCGTVSGVGTTFTATGLSITITPSSVSHSILINVNLNEVNIPGVNTSTEVGLKVQVSKDGAPIYTSLRAAGGNGVPGTESRYATVTIQFLHSPASTSAQTYTVEIASIDPNGIGIGSGGNNSFLTLQETA